MPGDPDPDELDSVLSDFRNGDDPTREQAMRRLQRWVGSAVEQEVGASSLDEAEEIARWNEARRRLLNRPDVASALMRAMEDESVRVRGTAALQLIDVESPEAERALVEHLRHDLHHHVRTMCIGALLVRKPEPPLAAFVDALGDTEVKVVFPACIALGNRGDLQAGSPEDGTDREVGR